MADDPNRDAPGAPQYADPKRYAELTGFEGTWRDLFWNRDFLQLIGRRFGFETVRRVLDVGCGAGHFGRVVLSVLPKDAMLVGVDQEPAFVELTRKQAAEHGLADRIEAAVGEADRLPFADDTFDLVVCQTLLIHVPDVHAVLREMMRVVKPGGLVMAAEPDNMAGNLALLNTWPRTEPADVVEIVTMQQTCERGKCALGEGDNSVGALLPGIMREVGLRDVRAHTSDRCIDLAPPYDAPHMRVALQQELAWAKEDISLFFGTRSDAHRLFLAGGGDEAGFERGWAAVVRWLRAFEQGVAAGSFHAARGFVFYLVAGRKPDAAGATPV